MKIITPDQVPALVPDGATVVSDGMTMMGVADELFATLETSFLDTNSPRDLTWVHAAGQSNRVAGLARIAHDGMVRRVVGSHWGLNPPVGELLGQDRAEGVCLPQGQLSTLFRSIAAGRPGQLSTVGLGTYVDPRRGAGLINDSARSNVAEGEYVQIVEVNGEEYIFYRAFDLDVALIRGSAIDTDGNLSHREEVSGLDALAIAQAVHNCGGVVIAQVREMVEPGDVDARDVTVPAPLVDYAVVCTDPQTYHRQSDSYPDVDRDLVSGHMDADRLRHAFEVQETPEHRLNVGRRGVGLVKHGDVINVGTGIPADTVGKALAEADLLPEVHLTVESGTYGGLPLGIVDFGCSVHPSAIVGHPQQMDFYNGGGVDITFMGAGQIDPHGDINVSFLGGNAIGCGGFMDIVDGARTVCFLVSVSGRHSKYTERVDQISFSGVQALRKEQNVYIATEYYLLKFTEVGWVLQDCDDSDDARAALERIPFTITGANND
jgi:propionate CoA-transferase